jgi:ABC-type glycerol-3-phosphate transport system substrate-binding protein
MVTPDPAQQDLAVRYLNWMMQPDFHAQLSRTLNWLPAQSSALEASLPNTLDPEWIETLLTNSVLPLPDSEGGTVPRAMQEALIAVINGDLTAQEATAQVVDQFAIESD